MTPKQNATSPTLVGRFLLSHAVVFFFHNQAPERRSGVLGGRSTSQIPFQAKSYTAVCPFPHINLPASQLRSNMLLFFSPFIFPPRLFASSPRLHTSSASSPLLASPPRLASSPRLPHLASPTPRLASSPPRLLASPAPRLICSSPRLLASPPRHFASSPLRLLPSPPRLARLFASPRLAPPRLTSCSPRLASSPRLVSSAPRLASSPLKILSDNDFP